MTKSEKVPILGIFSPKTILMFRVGLKELGKVGNRNHKYISFKPYAKFEYKRLKTVGVTDYTNQTTPTHFGWKKCLSPTPVKNRKIFIKCA